MDGVTIRYSIEFVRAHSRHPDAEPQAFYWRPYHILFQIVRNRVFYDLKYLGIPEIFCLVKNDGAVCCAAVFGGVV